MDRRRSDREARDITELARLRGALEDSEPYAGIPSSHLTAEQLEERVKWYGVRAQHLLLEARQSADPPPTPPARTLSVIDGGGERIEGRADLEIVPSSRQRSTGADLSD